MTTCQIECVRSLAKPNPNFERCSDRLLAPAPAPKPEPTYAVGQYVNVARRKQANENEEGGEGQIMDSCLQYTGVSWNEFYAIRYLVSGRQESMVSPEVFVPIADPGLRSRPSRTQQAFGGAGSPPSVSPAAFESDLAGEVRLTHQRLVDAEERHRKEIRHRDAANAKYRAIMRDAAKEARQARAQVENLHKQLKQAEATLTAEVKKCIDGIDYMIDTAIEDQIGTHEQELRALVKQRRELERQHQKETAKLRHQLSVALVTQTRMASNMEELVAEADHQQKVVEEQLETAYTELDLERESRMDLESQLSREEHQLETCFGLCEKLGIPTSGRLTTGTGSRKGVDVKRTQRLLSIHTAKILTRVLEICSIDGDSSALVENMIENGDFRQLNEQLYVVLEGADRADYDNLLTLRTQIIDAWRVHKNRKDTLMARLMFGLLSSSHQKTRILPLCRENRTVENKTTVVISHGGNKRTYGRVIEVMPLTMQVRVLAIPISEQMKKLRFPTLDAFANRLDSIPTAELDSLTSTVVPISQIRPIFSIEATEHEYEKSKTEALLGFPGSFPPDLNGASNPTRHRRADAWNALFASHLANGQLFSVAEASIRNARQGVQYMRKLSIRRSHEICRALFKEHDLKPPYWEEYLTVLSSRIFSKEKAKNCVCVHCRTLIYEVFDELRLIISIVAFTDEETKELLPLVDIAMRFISFEYALELREEHSCQYLCMRSQLTTANFWSFRHDCVHDPPTSTVQDMRTLVWNAHQRLPNSKDWNDFCLVCDDLGRVETCDHCNQAAHRKCILATWDDIDLDGRGDGGVQQRHEQKSQKKRVQPRSPPRSTAGSTNRSHLKRQATTRSGSAGLSAAADSDDAGSGNDDGVEEDPEGKHESTSVGVFWRCSECVKELEALRHHTDHPKFNLMIWIEAYLENALDVLGLREEAIGSVLEQEVADTSSVRLPPLEQAVRGVKQRLRNNLQSWRAGAEHKVRTKKLASEPPNSHPPPAPPPQVRTKKLAETKHVKLKNLKQHQAVEIADYMGKLDRRKVNQGTAEILGRKLSNHGSVFMFPNPNAETRARHPDFDWSNYPEPDDDCFLQVKVFSASNDADQSAYHMGGTTEAVYRALKISLPWITETIRISDQWYISS